MDGDAFWLIDDDKMVETNGLVLMDGDGLVETDWLKVGNILELTEAKDTQPKTVHFGKQLFKF